MEFEYKELKDCKDGIKLEIKEIDDIFKICNEFNKFNSDNIWIFRGESDYNWRLRTLFERAIIDYFIDKNEIKDKYNDPKVVEEKVQEKLEEFLLNWHKKTKSDEKNVIKFEDKVLRDYQRKSRNVMKYRPDYENWVEWLATMQHYGAPTRLMDWNYSFFIALYFAIENAISDCSIYALKFSSKNNNLYKEKIKKIYGKRFYKFVEYSSKDTERLIKKELTKDNSKKIVFPLNAFYLNKRLAIQQGVFLITGNIKYSFEDNLKNTFKDKLNENLYKIKIVYTPEFRQKILFLLRKMNITRFSLFPDINGFSETYKINFNLP